MFSEIRTSAYAVLSLKPDCQVSPTFLPFQAGNVDPAEIANFSVVLRSRVLPLMRPSVHSILRLRMTGDGRKTTGRIERLDERARTRPMTDTPFQAEETP
jgi:hypothetical protein